jgi:hypothetical protein
MLKKREFFLVSVRLSKNRTRKPMTSCGVFSHLFLKKTALLLMTLKTFNRKTGLSMAAVQ